MIAQTIDQLRHGKLNRADSTLGITAITLYIAQLINDCPQLWPLVGIGAAVAITLTLPLTIKQRKLGWIGLGILLIPCLVIFTQEPSHAILLTRVQNFMVNQLASGTNNAGVANIVNFTINAMRGFYILFLVGAVVLGLKDLAQGDGFGRVSQLAFYSVITIFGVDVISAGIVPDVTTPAT